MRVYDTDEKYHNLLSGFVAKWSGRGIGREIELTLLEGNVVVLKLLRANAVAVFVDICS